MSMQFQGVLKKMLTENGSPINYYLNLENDFLNLNQLIDKSINIKFVKYQCLNCGKDKKIYRQGYCYDCFYKTPQTGDWIMHPELSTAHLDKEDRDLEYEKEVQLKPHIVYLANSSNVKVGVTRKSQVPTRWIDQGAHEALVFIEVPNRYLAGITEVALKEHVSDKTNWRKMLTNTITDVDLKAQKEQLSRFIPEEVKPYFGLDTDAVHLDFPVTQYPVKVKSLSLDKTPEFTGTLKGIKGQYLIFEDGTVFNVRSYEGYVVKFDLN